MLNAGRRYLGTDDLRGRVFVTSGLGGMSGAQAKAAVIAGCVGVIAEVSSFSGIFLAKRQCIRSRSAVWFVYRWMRRR